MFEKPSIFKVPTISSNSYKNEACSTYNPSCNSNFTNTCADGYKVSYPGSGSSPTDIIGDAIGNALSVVGSTASVVALT